MADPVLTPQQEADAQRIAALVAAKTQHEVLQMVRGLLAKPDAQLLGAAEFEVRDHAHKIAACALQTALDERKKGGTKAPA
jgi:hypothetical protein